MDLTLVLSLLFLSCLHGVSSDPRYFTSLFTLGDSYIDAGNFVIMAARMVPPVPVWHDKPPYGMTFFGYPTGRLSDGRIITDFIAEQFGLPLLQASLLNISDVSKGVDFAVGGATAIDVDFYERNKLVQFKLLNNSLSVQLGWLEELKPSICKAKKGCRGCFSKALFFVGEFGVNDYNFVWSAGKTEDEVMSHVPIVVENIVRAVERLINGGAIHVLVPGNPPNGCSPTILTLRSSLNQTGNYDYMGCLSDINRVAMHHNSMLNASIGALRGKYPHARIIFADFYEPIITLLQSPNQSGDVNADALRACCGGGGEYNWNASAICGMPVIMTFSSSIFGQNIEIIIFHCYQPLLLMFLQYGSHSKKRPNNLVFGRTYDHHIYDLVEVGVENYKSIESYAYDKKFAPKLGTKPFFAFIGEHFESVEGLKHLKEMLLDHFKGEVVENLNLAGVDRIFVCTAISPTTVYMMHCALRLKRSGTSIPRMELVEVGPSMDLVVRRNRRAADSLQKEAMKAPGHAKKLKNVSNNPIDGKLGRVYIPDQEVSKLALTSDIKGLKRERRDAKKNKEHSKKQKVNPE